MKIEAILGKRRGKVVTTRPEASVSVVIHMLNAEKIGALVVSADGEHIEGLISERDIVRGLATYGAELPHMRTADLMTREVRTCAPGENIKDVMSKMTHSRIRHLPVVESGKLCGMISIGDVVKNRLEEAELESNVLHDYATARR